jgi:hypothetical protein
MMRWGFVRLVSFASARSGAVGAGSGERVRRWWCNDRDIEIDVDVAKSGPPLRRSAVGESLDMRLELSEQSD